MPTRLKPYVQNIVTLVTMQLKNDIREPLNFIWNFCFPIFLCLAFQYRALSAKGLGYSDYMGSIFPYLSYIVVMNSVYGCGAALLFWRESGYLKAFVHGRSHKNRLIVSAMLMAMLKNFVAATLFIAIVPLLFGMDLDTGVLARYALVTAFMSLLMSFASLLLLGIRTSASNIITLCSIVGAAWLTLSAFSIYFNPPLVLEFFYAIVNPLETYRSAFDLSMDFSLEHAGKFLVGLISLVGAGLLGFRQFSVSASVKR